VSTEEFVRLTPLGVWHIRKLGYHKTNCKRLKTNEFPPEDTMPKYSGGLFNLSNGALCQHCINPKHKQERRMNSKINPKHYEIKVDGHIIQVADLMEAHFPQDMHLSQAIKYLLRAGHKTDSSYVQDVGKCIWWCAKAVIFHGGKYIELPPGVKSANEMMKAATKKRLK